MAIPKDLMYSREHEWVRIEGDHAVIGITDHAQEALGEIVYRSASVFRPRATSSSLPSTRCGCAMPMHLRASKLSTPTSG